MGHRVWVLVVGGRLCEEAVEAACEVALEAGRAPFFVLPSASLRARYSLVAGSRWARTPAVDLLLAAVGVDRR